MTRLRFLAAAMLGSASALALAVPAEASRVLFATGAKARGADDLTPGAMQTVTGGITQIETDVGGIVSFVGAARFSADADRLIITQGQFTVTAAANGEPVALEISGTITALIGGATGAATFTIDAANLDGGGSSAMAVRGVLVSRPSDAAGERAVGSGLVIVPHGTLAPPPTGAAVVPPGEAPPD